MPGPLLETDKRQDMFARTGETRSFVRIRNTFLSCRDSLFVSGSKPQVSRRCHPPSFAVWRVVFALDVLLSVPSSVLDVSAPLLSGFVLERISLSVDR